MRLRLTSLAALTAVLTVTAMTGPATAAPPPVTESAVTDDGAYVRHDGGIDPAITECSNPATTPDVPAAPTATDADPTDGGNRRQGNEPAVAIDPTNPDVLAAGWNDYCQADLAAGWQGLAFSTDRGATWTDSVVPGYPLDDSAEGSVSPLKGRTDAGDPLVAFDGDGRLFVGGIAFNRAAPQLGDVWVATYGANPAGGLPKDYLRTRVVGRGTPAVNGIFQDKPMLEVDRTGGPNDGNVYVCWSRFVGVANGTTKIYFSRSTDHGVTFSKGVPISGDKQVQGCDIAVEGDGDVYVSWRTTDTQRPTDTTSMTVTRSANGGASFGTPSVAAAFTQYFPRVGGARDCGDGAFFCGEPGYVFHRVPLEPRITADQSGALPGVWVTYNAIDPTTTTAANSPYSSAGVGLVGRSVAYVKRSTTNGSTWSAATALDPAAGRGHQYFPDVDALDGRLVAVWQDNRTDDDYSIQLPIGNKVVDGRAFSSGDDVTGTYAATSTDGTSWTALGMVSAVTHQPQKEMFGSRQIPFQGDYNWAAVFPGGAEAYLTWTDNRDVVDGPDPRELAETPGYDDGFDVAQCLNDLGPASEPELNDSLPLARRDVPFSGNTCGNNGGLDQDIIGARVGLG